MSYDFTIQYHQDTLNSADELFWRLNYITEQSKKHHENDLISIYSEKFWQSEKHHKNNLILIYFQKSQLMHENSLTLICSEKSHFQNKKYHESLILW